VGSDVRVVVTMFNRGHIYINSLSSAVRQSVLALDGVDEVTVECVWDPPWTPDRLSPAARDVLGFQAGDPIEGRLHITSELKAPLDASPPFDERHLDGGPLRVTSVTQGQVAELDSNRLQRWRGGWKFYNRFEFAEGGGLSRRNEPVHLECSFDAEHIRDLAREARLVAEDSLEEVPCQVYGEYTEAGLRHCTIAFLADVEAREQRSYLLLYGNPSPACWTPFHSTDLVTRGEGYALEIENSYYRVRLSPVMGQLRNLEFKRWGRTCLGNEDPTAINTTSATNDPEAKLDIAWHGEDSCLHWNPDFTKQLRYRITNWPEPPHFSVARGPICTVVKRWGYPVCPVFPALHQTAVTIAVTYTFYCGLPYFTMESRLDVEEELDIGAVRNDEWVLFGRPFTHAMAMGDDGALETFLSGEGKPFESNPALVGLFHEAKGDAFVSLGLSYDARGFPGAYDPKGRGVGITGAGNQLWVRWAYHPEGEAPVIQPGATIGEHNAYLLYNVGEEGGHEQARNWYDRLRQPLIATQLNQRGRARVRK
jgi:metal-sulfur cluster biosynthetic enzyme